jgi:hypothetical protein
VAGYLVREATKQLYGKERMSEKTEFYRVRNVNGDYFGGHVSDPLFLGRSGVAAVPKDKAKRYASISEIIAEAISTNGLGVAFWVPYVVEHVTVEPGAVRTAVEGEPHEGYVVGTPTGGYLRLSLLGADVTDIREASVFSARSSAEEQILPWAQTNPGSIAMGRHPFRIYPVVRSEPREVVREVK